MSEIRVHRLAHQVGSTRLRAALSVGAIAVGVMALLPACRSGAHIRPNVEIVSRSSIFGTINSMPIDATVVATFNTGRGGRSTCEFSKLPSGFTPGTLSSHT